MARDPRSQKDDLTSIPTMKPAQDEVRGRRSQPRTSSATKPAKSSGGSGGGLLGVFTFLIAVTACGAAYYLWDQQQSALARAEQAEQRIQALEAQLASTGDEMSQSDAAVRVRLKELDTEVRKLWDNVWKKSRAQLAEHDKNIKNLTTRTSAMATTQESSVKQLKAINAELTRYSASLDEVSETLDALEASNRQTAQLREKLPQVSSMVDDHEQRIRANEEWVESINAFRRQVNQQLNANQPVNETPQLQ